VQGLSEYFSKRGKSVESESDLQFLLCGNEAVGIMAPGAIACVEMKLPAS